MLSPSDRPSLVHFKESVGFRPLHSIFVFVFSLSASGMVCDGQRNHRLEATDRF